MKAVKQKSAKNRESGQVVLVVLLIMVVGLTVGLAVIARSVTSIKVSTQEEDSQRAFYAAEAGLEAALLTGTTGTNSDIGLAGGYTVSITDWCGDTDPSCKKFVFPDTVKQDDTQTIWLVGHNSDGSICVPGGCVPSASPPDGRYPVASPIDVCWSNTGNPAMEVIIIYQETGSQSYRIARGAYDPDAGRRASNKFLSNDTSATNCNKNGNTFPNGQRIYFNTAPPGGFGINQINNRIIALRLRPIYSGAKIGVVSDPQVIPPQGKNVESLGKAGVSQRKLKVIRSWPAFPPIFDFAVFSGKELSK